jgi:hypothetical protein
MERIKVKSGYAGTADESRVAFSDPSTVHGPDGAFVYGKDEFEIAVTPEVLDAIRHGRLVVCEGPGAEESEHGEVTEELAAMVVTANEGAEDAAEEADADAAKGNDDDEPAKTEVEMPSGDTAPALMTSADVTEPTDRVRGRGRRG